MPYDTWEFDLEVTNERLRGCDSYIYIGSGFNNFLNDCKYKTELIFCLDILEAVVISFENSNINYEELIKSVSLKLNSISQTLDIYEARLYKFSTKTYETFLVQNTPNIYLLVASSKYSSSVLNTIL